MKMGVYDELCDKSLVAPSSSFHNREFGPWVPALDPGACACSDFSFSLHITAISVLCNPA